MSELQGLKNILSCSSTGIQAKGDLDVNVFPISSKRKYSHENADKGGALEVHSPVFDEVSSKVLINVWGWELVLVLFNDGQFYSLFRV